MPECVHFAPARKKLDLMHENTQRAGGGDEGAVSERQIVKEHKHGYTWARMTGAASSWSNLLLFPGRPKHQSEIRSTSNDLPVAIKEAKYHLGLGDSR